LQLKQIENKLFISDEDNKDIIKQCMLFFSSNKNTPLTTPHDAILSYQKLNIFWNEFGLNYFDLQELPHDLFLQLSMVVREKINVSNRDVVQNQSKNKPKGKDRFNKSMSL
jgi:hypothetical protein